MRHSGNCPSNKCLFGKLPVRGSVPRGTVHRGNDRRGKVRQGNVCRLTVRIPVNSLFHSHIIYCTLRDSGFLREI